MANGTINGNVQFGPLAKMLATGLSILIVGWLSWNSLLTFQLRAEVYTMNTDLSKSVTQITNDISWIKNEATKGGRFTSIDGARHETMIEKVDSCWEENRERIIKLEK